METCHKKDNFVLEEQRLVLKDHPLILTPEGRYLASTLIMFIKFNQSL